MNRNDPTGGNGHADRYAPMLQGEPSMNAPSSMPARPVAAYVQQPASGQAAQQAAWQTGPTQQTPAHTGWTGGQQPQAYTGYPVQQGYQPPPSQGIPGGQPPPQQYGWQQGYAPAPRQNYPGYQQQPTGRGWTGPYPAQNQSQNNWQGGYAVSQWGASNGYTPGYGQNPPPNGPIQGGGGGGGNHGGSGGGKSSPEPGAIIKLVAVIAVVLIAVAVIVGLISKNSQSQALQDAVDAYNDRYCQGVYVDGIHLGGMTYEEAKAAVQKSAQLKCDEWNVALVTTNGDYVGEINSYHLGMTVRVDDALNDAWQQGHTGATYTERMAAMEALLETPYHTSTALPSGDTAAIDRILNEIAATVYEAPVDATAHFEPLKVNPFTYTPEKVGKYLDVNSIKEQVYDMVSRMESGTIVIEPTPLYPSYTEEQLRSYTTLIGTHYTEVSTTSTPERNENLRLACKKISGTVIEPGRTFSFNNVVGPRTKKEGFQLATVYSYGKETPGYGGGVCQVSSTIYVAAVRANMEIVTRRQHGLKVNYTDLGLDATVNYEGKKIDFVFRNTSGGNIYIVTKVMRKPQINKNHDLVICEIYGPALETGVTYDLVATEVEVPIPAATTVPDKKAEHVVYTDETYTEPGRIGYEVDSYKVKYVNGEKVEEIHMYHDTYEAVAPIIYTGVNERPLPVE